MLLSSLAMVLKVVCVLVHRSQWTWEVGLCASKFFTLIVKNMCLAARVFWCCRCGGCVRCSIQQPRCRCVSAIFFARCHNIVETPQKVTGALRFQKRYRHHSSPEDVRLCCSSFGDPVCCDAFVSLQGVELLATGDSKFDFLIHCRRICNAMSSLCNSPQRCPQFRKLVFVEFLSAQAWRR